jgi:hypothetical protein
MWHDGTTDASVATPIPSSALAFARMSLREPGSHRRGRFDCLVEDCIESAPSRQPNARWYGMRLPGDHPQAQKGMRVPAGDIEGLVLDRLKAFFLSRIDAGNAIAPLDLDARTLDAALRNAFKHSEGIVTADGSSGMSLGTILLIILVIALLGGFSGLGGGPFYGTGYYGGGGLGLILVVVLILVLLGKALNCQGSAPV